MRRRVYGLPLDVLAPTTQTQDGKEFLALDIDDVTGIVYCGGVSLGGGGGNLTLETNGVPNGSQSLLNLVNGENVTLTDDGFGNITISASGGGGTPGGSSGQVQFNNSGAFDGDADFLWDSTGKILSVGPPGSDLDPTLAALIDSVGGQLLVTCATPSPPAPPLSALLALCSGPVIAIALTAAATVTGPGEEAVGGTFLANSAGTGDVTALFGLVVGISHASSGTLAEVASVTISAPGGGGGQIADYYGIKIADQNVATNNWAIKTGLGLVEFGDSVVCDGGLSVGGNIGFYGTSSQPQPTVTGAKLPSDVALASLLTALAGLGLLIDSTS